LNCGQQLHEEVEDIWKSSSSSALLDKLLHDFDNAKVVEVRGGRRCKFFVAQIVADSNLLAVFEFNASKNKLRTQLENAVETMDLENAFEATTLQGGRSDVKEVILLAPVAKSTGLSGPFEHPACVLRFFSQAILSVQSA
jgi:hypothetical protein